MFRLDAGRDLLHRRQVQRIIDGLLTRLHARVARGAGILGTDHHRAGCPSRAPRGIGCVPDAVLQELAIRPMRRRSVRVGRSSRHGGLIRLRDRPRRRAGRRHHKPAERGRESDPFGARTHRDYLPFSLVQADSAAVSAARTKRCPSIGRISMHGCTERRTPIGPFGCSDRCPSS